MATTTVSNSAVSVNADYLVKKTNLGGGDIQHVGLYDIVADAAFSSTNPLTTTSIYSTVGDGRQVVTTAGTRVQFSTVTTKKVDITALSSNTGTVVIGAVTCIAAAGTRRGTPLVAGQTYSIEVSNLNLLYIDSTVNGEGVSYAYFL